MAASRVPRASSKFKTEIVLSTPGEIAATGQQEYILLRLHRIEQELSQVKLERDSLKEELTILRRSNGC